MDCSTSTDEPSFMVFQEPSSGCGRPMTIAARNLANSLPQDAFKVFLRLKPNPRGNTTHILNSNQVITHVPKESSSYKVLMSSNHQKKRFIFTATLDEKTSQRETFETCVLPSAQSFLAGEDCVVMAFGTSSAGKTFTMHGTSQDPGMIPRVLSYVFRALGELVVSNDYFMPHRNFCLVQLDAETRLRLSQHKSRILGLDLARYEKCTDTSHVSSRTFTGDHYESIDFKEIEGIVTDYTHRTYTVDAKENFSVWLSMVEIYNERIVDLLHFPNGNGDVPTLSLGEDDRGGFYVKNAQLVPVRNGHEAYQVTQFGRSNLHRAPTALNLKSSRSHCLLTITLVSFINDVPSVHRLTLADLAGSERVNKTQNIGKRLVESKSINKSLSSLGNCLKVLRENQATRIQKMVPYRDSKLTKLFKNALQGTEKLAFIVNVSTDPLLFDETLGVLKFSAMAHEIVMEPPSRPVSRFSQRFQVGENSMATLPPPQDTSVAKLMEAQRKISENEAIIEDLRQQLQIASMEVLEIGCNAEEQRKYYLRCLDEAKEKKGNLGKKLVDVIKEKNDEKAQAIKRLKEQHNEQVSELSNMIRELRKQVHEDTEIKELREHNKELESLLNEADKDYKAQLDENKKLMKENNELVDGIEQLSNELAVVKASLEEEQDRSSSLVTQNNSLIKEVQALIAENAAREEALKIKNEALLLKIDQLAAEVEVERVHTASWQEAFAREEAEREADRRRAAEAEGEVVSLQAAIKNTCETETRLLKENAVLSAAVKSLEQEAETNKDNASRMNELEEELKKLRQECNNEKEFIKLEHSKCLQNLNTELADCKTKLGAAEYQNRAYRALKDKAEEEAKAIPQLKEQIMSLENQLTMKDEEMQSFESRRNHLIEMHEIEVKRYQKDIEMLQKNIDFRQAVIMENMKKSDDLDEIKELKEQLRMMQMHQVKFGHLETGERSPLRNKTNTVITGRLLDLSPFCDPSKKSYRSKSEDDILSAVFKEPKPITPKKGKCLVTDWIEACNALPPMVISENDKENFKPKSKVSSSEALTLPSRPTPKKSKQHKKHKELANKRNNQDLSPPTSNTVDDLVKVDDASEDIRHLPDELIESEPASPLHKASSPKSVNPSANKSDSSPDISDSLAEDVPLALIRENIINNKMDQKPDSEEKKSSESPGSKQNPTESESASEASPAAASKSAREPRTTKKQRDMLDHPALSRSARGRRRSKSSAPQHPAPPRSVKKQLFSCDQYVELSDSDFLEPDGPSRPQRSLRSRSKRN